MIPGKVYETSKLQRNFRKKVGFFLMPQFEQKNRQNLKMNLNDRVSEQKLKAKTVYSKGIAERSALKACF